MRFSAPLRLPVTVALLALLAAAGCRKEGLPDVSPVPDARPAGDAAPAAEVRRAPDVVPAPEAGAVPAPTEVRSEAACRPQCAYKDCGEDGCGGSCGDCPRDYVCMEGGVCGAARCTPDCKERECGGDGCGGSCGKCPEGRLCNADGRCEVPPCRPDCTSRVCGDDGCGGTCGMCPPGENCIKGRCSTEPCTPDCKGRICGDDGCGGSCGTCPVPDACRSGRCERRIAFGLFVGPGREPWKKVPMTWAEAASSLGRTPAVAHEYLGFPADWNDGKCSFAAFPQSFADGVLETDKSTALMLSLMPQCGFDKFVTGFAPGNEAYEATKALAIRASKYPGTVFLRFAHDMNTHWFPWATCFFGNEKAGCVKDPKTYVEGFRNFANLVHETAPDNVRVVWSPHEWMEYWGRDPKLGYPQYADFYPGDDAVDWVGLDLYYTASDPPGPGNFKERFRWFYEQFAAPGGHNKPMMIPETAAECGVREGVQCVRAINIFDTTGGWYRPWGDLVFTAADGANTVRCPGIAMGTAHLVMKAKPDPKDPEGHPNFCSKYYIGGTGYTVDWVKGMDFAAGNVFVFHGKRDPGPAANPVLQIDVCDTKNPECPPREPCCARSTLSAYVTVAATEWTQYVIPFADFKPTEAGANPSLNWHAVRVLNFHLLCEAGGGNLAPLHLDGIAAGAWRREGGNRCKTTALAWAEQLLSPGHCSEWPNLRMILWTHDRREQRGRTLDYRIPDFRAFGSLLGRDACFSGRIPPPVPAAQ